MRSSQAGAGISFSMNAEWRNYAKPEEIAEHDGLIAVDRANAARRRLIRNRCNMRKKQAK